MSIRPTYRKRSVVQVLADGMSAHPPTGRSCCEEAVSMTEENWTRDDLPSVVDLADFVAGDDVKLIGRVLDAVVAHLNENGGVPAEARQSGTHINVTADADSTPADFSEKLQKLSEEFRNNAQMRALRDAEGNVVEHVLTPRRFASGGYVASPEERGKSCCEEAQLTANELARRNEELSEAEEEIAALKDQVCDWKNGADAEAWAHDEAREKITGLVNEIARIQGDSKAEIKALTKRAEKAEVERDEAWKEAEVWRKLWAKVANRFIAGTNEQQIERERDAWRENAKTANDEAMAERDRAVRAEAERDELQAKLDAAENRPTLDREAVMETIIDATNGQLTDHEDFLLTEAIMDLAAAEGWPEWLGPKVDPGDYEVTRGRLGAFYIDDDWAAHANSTVYGLRKLVAERIGVGARYEAVARFIESEQAEANTSGDSPDEDQRVEELAKALANATHDDPWKWYSLAEPQRDQYRAARATG